MTKRFVCFSIPFTAISLETTLEKDCVICGNMTDSFLFWYGRYFNVALNFEKVSSKLDETTFPLSS